MAAIADVNRSKRSPAISEVDDDLFIIYEWGAFYGIPIEYLYFIDALDKRTLDLTIDNVKSLSAVMMESLAVRDLKATANMLDLSIETASMMYTKLSLGLAVPRENEFLTNPNVARGGIYKTLMSMEPVVTRNQAILIMGKLLDRNKLPGKWLQHLNAYFKTRKFPVIDSAGFRAQYAILNSLEESLPNFYNTVNRFIKESNGSPYVNTQTYIEDYKRWLKRWNLNTDKVKRVVHMVKEQRDTILENPALPTSQFSSTEITMRGKGVWDIRSWMDRNEDPISEDEIIERYGLSPSIMDDTPVQLGDGIELFNMIKISIDVPYVRYNTGKILKTSKERVLKVDRSLTKIYHSPDSPHQKYENVIPNPKKVKDPNMIYLVVWLGAGSKSSAPKDSYFMVEYDLVRNNIKMQISGKKKGDVDVIKEKVLRALPIRVPNWVGDQMNAEFSILGANIDIYSLLYLLRIYPEFKYYLYVNEGSKPIASKPTVYIHYRSPLSYLRELDSKGFASKVKKIQKNVNIDDTFNKVHFSYVQNIAGTGDTFESETLNGMNVIRLKKGEPYITFRVLNVTEYEVKKTMLLLSHLLSYYNELKNPIMDLNEDLVPELRDAMKTQLPKVAKKHRESTNEILRKLAPDIFVENYASLTQRAFQPIPINASEKSAWENRKFMHKGKLIKRQVMSYPPPFVDHEKILLVCPNDEDPYPGVKINTLDNKDKFPYLPYCYKTDNMSPHVQSHYNAWFRNQAKMVKRHRVRKVGGHRIAEDMRYGNLPPNVKKLLEEFDPEAFEFKRMGMPISPSSILHAILSINNDSVNLPEDVLNEMDDMDLPDYTDEGISDRQRNSIVSLVRQDMAEKTDINLLMQENWDETPDEIRESLADETQFLDPFRYYRAIEEYFNLSIFTFSNSTRLPASNSDGYSIQFNQLEIPRHNQYYLRRENINRPAVILFKFQATVYRGQQIPAQCELIVRKIEDSGYSEGIFDGDEEVIDHLYDLFHRMTNIYQWSIGPTIDQIPITLNNETTKEALIVGRSLNDGDFSELGKVLNLRSQADIVPISQILDDFGKCRAIYYEVTLSNANHFNLLAVVLPVQPYALPLVDIKQIILPSYQQIQNIIRSDIIGVTRKASSRSIPAAARSIPAAARTPVRLERESESVVDVKLVTGLWYSAYQRTYAIFIPIQDTVEPRSLAEIGEGRKTGANMIKWLGQIDKSDRIDRMIKLTQINVTILSVLEWLFRLSEQDPKSFINILTYPEREFDPLKVYKLEHLNYRYPEVDSLIDGFHYIQDNTSGLTDDEHIIAYNRDYYDSLVFFIKDLAKTSKGLVVSPPANVPNNYQRSKDFYHDSDTLIFTSTDDLEIWLRDERSDMESNLVMRDKLGNYLFKLTEPYLFNYKEMNSVYLIQNVDSIDISIERYDDIIDNNPDVDPSQRARDLRTIRSRRSSSTRSQSGAEERKFEKKLHANLVQFAKSLNIANTWKHELVNIGHFTPELSGVFPPYIVYEIVEGQTLKVKTDRSAGDPDPLKIIAYKEGYGAMLRIA
jgi:uncharacterized protein DUF5757